MDSNENAVKSRNITSPIAALDIKESFGAFPPPTQTGPTKIFSITDVKLYWSAHSSSA